MARNNVLHFTLIMTKALSKWLRTGVIKQNIKNTLKSTIDALHNCCTLKVTRESLYNSLRDILYNDKVFREESEIHTRVFSWLEEKNVSSPKQSSPFAVFKKRAYTSAVGSAAVVNNYNYDRNIRESSPPPMKQLFSFSDDEQGAIIEPLLNLVEKELNKFLVNNEHIIPFNVVEIFASKQYPPINPDFSNADTLSMLNFIIENIKIFEKSVFHGQHKTNPAELFNNFKKNVRNKIAHGIVVDENGRWSDHALQHFTILACEVIICLGK